MLVVGGIDVTGAIIAAFGTLLIYDVFFVTFDREVSLVWPSHWGFVKTLFFLNRYLPFIDTFLSLHLLIGRNRTSNGCTIGFGAVTWLILMGFFISETILMIRTFAVWECRREVLFGLYILAAGTFLPSIVIAQFEVMSLEYKLGATGHCIKARPSSRIIFIAYLLLMICETVIVGLTLVQAWPHYRASQIQSPLIWQLYRDGLLYFVYLQAFSVFNVIVAIAGPPGIVNVFATPQRVLHSLLCSRVLLHIRAHSGVPEEITTTQVAMAFAERGLGTSLESTE